MSSSLTGEAADAYAQALDHHRRRCLTEAGRAYAQALEYRSMREPSSEEIALVLRHAPRIFTTPDEPLPLKDFAAIIHPALPLIGYHFFWEDDIDFPLDRDPCDHEIVWVGLDSTKTQVTNVFTYYHNHILTTPTATDDARIHGGRPRVEVQWGKHGSLPAGWAEIADGAVLADMERTYRRLSEDGCREAGHPLARGWPERFAGSWHDFVNFAQEIDPQRWLQERAMIRIGEFANAIIFWHFLRYNFCPKPSWPDLERPGEAIW